MATSAEIKQKAIALAEKTDVNSITPKEVGGIMYDIASHSENVLRNGGTLGIRKVYESVASMEADSTNPKDFWGDPIKKGNLVVIYDGTTTGVDNNKIYAFMKPGWQLATHLDAGYATKAETDEKLAELGSKSVFVTGCSFIKELYINEAGKAKGINRLHLVRANEKGYYLAFSGTETSGFLGYTNLNHKSIEAASGIQPITNNGLANGTLLGYVIVDWTNVGESDPLQVINDNCYNNSYSPSIKSMLESSDLQNAVNAKFEDNIFVVGCPFVKELYINAAGKAAGITRLNNVVVSNEVVQIRFAGKPGGGILGFTPYSISTIENAQGILPITSDGYNGELRGYIVIDWHNINTELSPQAYVNNSVYNLDYSPSIKSLIIEESKNSYVAGYPFLKELYINEAGVSAGIKRMHNIRATDDTGYYITFTGEPGSGFLGYTPLNRMSIDSVRGILPITSSGNEDGEIRGYVIVNWTNMPKEIDPQAYINNNCYNLDYSPSIKSMLGSQVENINVADLSRNGEVVLYNMKLNSQNEDIIGEQYFSANGLIVDRFLFLDKFYAASDRTIKYVCKFASDTIAKFACTLDATGNNTNTPVLVDVANKRVSISTYAWESCEVLNSSDIFLISITKHYQDLVVEVENMYNGDKITYHKVRNGTGGEGAGAVGVATPVGMQRDYYCFSLESGSAYYISQIIVNCAKVDLLMYGASINEPEAYYPTEDFNKSWTQLVIQKMKGRAMSSGRSGTGIYQLLERIKNELPFIKAKYVMITVGTNGGNTVENLSQLVDYIESQGSICILNHIPANINQKGISNQVEVNAIIDRVRELKGVHGADFDIPTSMNHDGVDVDTSQMWEEDYGGETGTVWHHPNVKGSATMFARLLIDVPEIFE